MFQLILVILLGLLNTGISVYSYRRAQSAYGVDDRLYNIWWWLSLCTAISVMCIAISAGTVIKRIYF